MNVSFTLEKELSSYFDLSPEENDDDTECRTGIERGGEDVVVLRPPREVPSPDGVLEDEPDDGPWHVVDSRCRRDCTRS